LETPEKSKPTRFSIAFVMTVIFVSLLVGGVLGYSIGYSTVSERISNLQNQLSALQGRISDIQSTLDMYRQNITYPTGGNASLSSLYEQVKDSVVVVRGLIVQYDLFGNRYYSSVQGSGFVYNFTGRMVIVTNNHVIRDVLNVTVTFIDGSGYVAKVLGSDPYADLAVLSVGASPSEYEPLEVVSSSFLSVGDPVSAVGSPYGLAGSMTAGIVSALGRTITESVAGGYPIANIIQTTAPINPGNSGGPLLNYRGQVVGITTAIVAESQGIGFAIPSNTILREISYLVEHGSYNRHPWLGVAGADMTYEIARAMNVNVTYGWLVVQVMKGSPADRAGIRAGTREIEVAGERVTIGGDIIVALDGVRIVSGDSLATYLEEYAQPGQTISATIVRNDQTISVSVELGTRPPQSS